MRPVDESVHGEEQALAFHGIELRSIVADAERHTGRRWEPISELAQKSVFAELR